MKLLAHLLAGLALSLLVQAAYSQRTLHDVSKLRDGDLLFVVASTSNAITEVTSGIHSLPIDHVGIYHSTDARATVIEATYGGVVETPFDQFLSQSGTLLVGRVKGRVDMAGSIRNALSHLGQPYDHVYLPDNDAMYCSELVQTSYVDPSGALLFPPIGMTFRGADGQLLPYWEDFYSRRARRTTR